jgi:hypothetical protein
VLCANSALIATIEWHRAHLMRKLGVDNVVGLVKRAISMGLVDLEEKQEPNETSPDSENDEQVLPFSVT